jgi:hypothetical protein
MPEFDPDGLNVGRDLALSRARVLALDMIPEGPFDSVESLAREAGVSGVDPWRRDGSPLFLMHEALQKWEQPLHVRFIVLMGEHTTLAAMSRTLYRDSPLSQADVRGHIEMSVQFFNSFSHR